MEINSRITQQTSSTDATHFTRSVSAMWAFKSYQDNIAKERDFGHQKFCDSILFSGIGIGLRLDFGLAITVLARLYLVASQAQRFNFSDSLFIDINLLGTSFDTQANKNK